MRRTLAILALAVTSMIVLSFLLPLAVIVRDVARDRAIVEAERLAATLTPVLVLTAAVPEVRAALEASGNAGRLCVHLPGGQAVGAPRAAPAEVERTMRAGRPRIVDVEAGVAVLQPAAVPGERTAVIEVFVSDQDLRRGVRAAWLVVTGIAVVLVISSLILMDRLGSRVVAAARELSGAATALGSGDLKVRVRPQGPRELRAAGAAFNNMADRVVHLLTSERELIADLSHRLRTPLAALRLDADALGAGPGASRIRSAVEVLERELDAIIRAARRPAGTMRDESCDAAEVLRDRVAFWSVLADDQGRSWELTGAEEPALVPLPRAELMAVIDALLGNVFRHTPHGTAFALHLHRTPDSVLIIVEDAGPGISDPQDAARRGASGGGSTGLGLDIARRAAAGTAGEMRISRGPLGGAWVQLRLRTLPHLDPPRRLRRRRRLLG